MFFKFLAEIRLRTPINHLKKQVLDPFRAIFIPPAPCQAGCAPALSYSLKQGYKRPHSIVDGSQSSCLSCMLLEVFTYGSKLLAYGRKRPVKSSLSLKDLVWFMFSSSRSLRVDAMQCILYGRCVYLFTVGALFM